MHRSTARRTALALTSAAVAGLLGVGAAGSSASAMPAAPRAAASHSRPALVLRPTQFTRSTLDLTGTWRLTSTFTSRLGVPIRPGSFGGNDVDVTLHRWAGQVSPMANDPVYIGSLYDATTHKLVADELIVSPFVSPRGIELTMWQGGNPEGFSDAYEAVYTVAAVNTTRSPLAFTGTWLDLVHNAGTSTMVRAPRFVPAS